MFLEKKISPIAEEEFEKAWKIVRDYHIDTRNQFLLFNLIFDRCKESNFSHPNTKIDVTTILMGIDKLMVQARSIQWAQEEMSDICFVCDDIVDNRWWQQLEDIRQKSIETLNIILDKASLMEKD